MSDFELPNTDEPFDDLDSVLASIGHSLISKGKTQIASLFATANISMEFTAYDNWDGGTSVWILWIEIPYPKCSTYTDEERKEIESFINSVIKPFLPEIGHWVTSRFRAVSIKDPNWRKNISNQSGFTMVDNNHHITGFEKVSKIASLLTNQASGHPASNDEYSRLRHELLSNQDISDLLPNWLKTHRNLDSFWGFIQPKYSTYTERRTFLAEEFSPALNSLEFGHSLEVNSQGYTPSVKTLGATTMTNTKKKVFIVHGRDNETKQEVSRYN